MIVREQEQAFVMVEQNWHGIVSEEMMRRWKKEWFPQAERRDSVLRAIQCHDLGWEPFDREPFWNDAKQTPYTFIDFPLPAKLILYAKGIDEVETVDQYAAMLCSYHYCQFMLGSKNREVIQFVEQEKTRRLKLVKEIQGFEEDVFFQHYGLLQIGDNLSLYVCINEPGVNKEQEHPFFIEGIPSPDALVKAVQIPTHRMDIHFIDEQTIGMKDFPFDAPFTVSIPQRVVLKKDIAEKGLVKAYQETSSTSVQLYVTD